MSPQSYRVVPKQTFMSLSFFFPFESNVHKPGMVAQTCNPRTWGAASGRL